MVDKLEAPAALKTGKLTGKANYKYWATVWIGYLQSLDLQGLLECCKEEDKAHAVANGTLLGLICEAIEPDAISRSLAELNSQLVGIDSGCVARRLCAQNVAA